MNKKTIIHQTIPTDEYGKYLLSPHDINRFAELTKINLGNDYILIVSPMETKAIDGDDILINIDCKEYSYNELKEIIEKAKNYDNLIK